MATVSSLDSRLAADVAALVARQHLIDCGLAEQRHLVDPDYDAYAALPAEHPETVTYDATWQPGGTS